MKVTLFGGETFLIQEGLRRDIELTVIGSACIDFNHPKINVINGDLTDAHFVRASIRGSDAVLCAIEPTALKHPDDLHITQTMTQAMATLLAAMQEENVTRLIALSSCTVPEKDDQSDWKISLATVLLRLFLPRTYKDITEQARAIRASHLDWTLFRIGFLTDSPATHRVNIGSHGETKHSMTMSREDMAALMFEDITEAQWIRKAPRVSAG